MVSLMHTRLYLTLSVATIIMIVFGTYQHTAIQYAHTAALHCSTTLHPSITAEAFYVYDIKNSRVLFEKNADAQLSLASLTKIITVAVAAQTIQANDTVTITSAAFEPEGDSGFGLNEVWTARDLINFTMMTSSNDGARALALKAGEGSLDSFVAAMNAFAREAGTQQTFFLNDTGLDVSPVTAGAYGSARDMALLMTHAYQHVPDIFSDSAHSVTRYTSVSGQTHESRHTSSVAGNQPGQLIVKTGFTDLAGGNLAVLMEIFPGRPVALVVLGATRETRDGDIETLVEASRDMLKRIALCNHYGS
jgi:serine-type D-Ala-D-Ala carboxypeptidase (penicillin-binding protein 5/6)